MLDAACAKRSTAVSLVLKGVMYNKISNYFTLKPETCEKPLTIQLL